LKGIIGPVLFGKLIGTSNREHLFWGYVAGSSVMIGAAIIEVLFGVKAEQKSLEELHQQDQQTFDMLPSPTMNVEHQIVGAESSLEESTIVSMPPQQTFQSETATPSNSQEGNASLKGEPNC
jgi:hypothetical protein